MSDWINVEDEYPKAGTWVVGATWLNNGERVARELFYDGENEHGHHWLDDGDWGNKVTHWQPLPEPPK